MSEFEPGPAMDILIAEQILRRPGPFRIDERGVARGQYEAEVPFFSTADAVAVAYVLPKLRERCSLEIKFILGQDPSVTLDFQEHRVIGLGKSLAAALCRAALQLKAEAEKR